MWVVGGGDRFPYGPAFIWDTNNGLRRLQDLVNAVGWTLNAAYSISDDNSTIVGTATNPSGKTEAWRISTNILNFPSPVTLLTTATVQRATGFVDLIAWPTPTINLE